MQPAQMATRPLEPAARSHEVPGSEREQRTVQRSLQLQEQQQQQRPRQPAQPQPTQQQQPQQPPPPPPVAAAQHAQQQPERRAPEQRPLQAVVTPPASVYARPERDRDGPAPQSFAQALGVARPVTPPAPAAVPYTAATAPSSSSDGPAAAAHAQGPAAAPEQRPIERAASGASASSDPSNNVSSMSVSSSGRNASAPTAAVRERGQGGNARITGIRQRHSMDNESAGAAVQAAKDWAVHQHQQQHMQGRNGWGQPLRVEPGRGGRGGRSGQLRGSYSLGGRGSQQPFAQPIAYPMSPQHMGGGQGSFQQQQVSVCPSRLLHAKRSMGHADNQY